MRDGRDLDIAQPVAIAATGERTVEAIALSEDARWDRWKAKGRADDLRFHRRLKTLVVDGAAVIAFGGALWFAFQF